MVKLAIRDDDLNFFSKIEDVENAYSPIKGFPISFAIIPAVTDVSTIGLCPETRGNKTPMYIGDNIALVEWLKNKKATDGIDICMHGINHTYHFNKKGNKVAEMVWRDEPELAEAIGIWKGKLEKDLSAKISCFVAPSNLISKYGINCIAKNQMDYSGIVPLNFQREFTSRNVVNYIKRWSIRAIDRLPYPGVLHYSSHKEINACTIQSYEYLVRMFKFCKKNDLPMAINVHYWKLRDFPEERDILIKFVEYALKEGAQPATLSDILHEA